MPGEYAVADVQACNVLVPNVLQKAVFRRAKRGLSPCDWWHIASRKAANCGSSANPLDGNNAQQGVEDVQRCLAACGAKRNLRYVCANNIVLEEGERHLRL